MNSMTLPEAGTGRTTARHIALISLATIAAYAVVRLTGVPPLYLLPVAIVAAGGMEYMLITWALGLLEATPVTSKMPASTERESGFARKSRIAGMALDGRVYSQQIILAELRALLVERAAARNQVGYRQLTAIIDEKGAFGFFGNKPLAELYKSSFSGKVENAKMPASKKEFAEKIENAIECLEDF
ncbi:MAG: hypothetical protein KIS30_07280 [Thermoplasmata archaeon]|nr:hypothetical protein [Candidatus Sysuiplasma acidicola]MBX8646541.1 hypothetical protein [Candidatus Sysuiplasma acidicola]MDH2906374.1 hypothetical protein [Methanomassiliicoccales archaeon]